MFSQEKKVEKHDFYKALAADNLNIIEDEITTIEKSSIFEKNAFVGTLLMKKSKLISNPANKLSCFKEGMSMLEKAIEKDKTNPEYRFLRLLIQENAPRFLGYYENLDEDSKIINIGYATLPEEVKAAVRNYAKNSKVLILNE